MQGNKRGRTGGSSPSKNSDIFSLYRQLVLGFGYFLMVPWLFCFLCFTSPVSLTSFYVGDMLNRAFMSSLFSGKLFQLLQVSKTVKVPGHCASAFASFRGHWLPHCRFAQWEIPHVVNCPQKLNPTSSIWDNILLCNMKANHQTMIIDFSQMNKSVFRRHHDNDDNNNNNNYYYHSIVKIILILISLLDGQFSV